MYEKGDYVVKIPDGICRVNDVCLLNIPGSSRQKEYYMLVPVNEKTAKIYVPVDAAETRIRSVLSGQAAIQFIKALPEISELNIPNEKMREHEYRAAILSGDIEKTAGILKTLYKRKMNRNERGKKSTSTDDGYFRQAEKVLYSELSFALNVPVNHMEQFIADTIEGRAATL